MVVLARKCSDLAAAGLNRATPQADAIAMQKIAAGEINEIDKIVEGYGLAIWTLANRFTITPDDAMKAVSEIVTDIVRSAGEFDPAKTALLTFIKRISHRRLMAGRSTSVGE